MPTRSTESEFICTEAINFIRTACTDSRRAHFEKRGENDIGIDGYIELLHQNGEPSGAYAWIQSKGSSSPTTRDRYQLRADKKHFETWFTIKYPPVIGIVYNSVLKKARWINISEHLQSHPERIQTGPYTIYSPADQPFSVQDFAKFQSHVEALHAQLSVSPVEVLINQYFSSSDVIKKLGCLIQLSSNYGWTPLVCLFLHQALRIEEEANILREIIYRISFYSSLGPEHYLHKNADTVNLAQKCIAGFGKTEVVKMMSVLFDENEKDFGGMGMIVQGELYDVSNIENILCEIAKDSTLETQIRDHAIFYLIIAFHYTDASFLQSLLQEENKDFDNEKFDWIPETISTALDV